MVENKYLIIIGVIISLLFAYYCWDEISTVKKIAIPNYQRTMQLESKIIDMETKTNMLMVNLNNGGKKQIKQLRQKNHVDSPAYSITYQSDMINKNRGNLSVVCGDLSESEINSIRGKLKTGTVVRSPKNTKPKLLSPGSEINVGRGRPTESGESYKNILDILSSPRKLPKVEFHSLTATNIADDSEVFGMFDEDVARHISDSINCIDLNEDNMEDISEIPSEFISDFNSEARPNRKNINKTLPHKKSKKRNSK